MNYFPKKKHHRVNIAHRWHPPTCTLLQSAYLYWVIA